MGIWKGQWSLYLGIEGILLWMKLDFLGDFKS